MANTATMLLDINRQTMESERQALRRAVERWQAALDTATRIRDGMVLETTIAAQGGTAEREALVAWLIRTRTVLADADDQAARAEAEMTRLRMSLADARARVRATEIVVERQIEKARAVRAHRAQAELDEVGSRRHAAQRG